ncbi:MAG: hypothetical protein WC878_04825 [Candidatus Paceibacterota bacterium]|jgi:hypothetical protein
MNQELESNDLSNQLPQSAVSANAPISGVSFNEQLKSSFRSRERNGGMITKLAIKTGLVKDEKQAMFALGILAVIIFSVAILIWPSGEIKVSPQVLEQQQRDMEKMIQESQSLLNK